MALGAAVKAGLLAGAKGVKAKVVKGGALGMGNLAFQTFQGVNDVNYRMDQGDSMGKAIVKTAAETALYLNPYTAPAMFAKDMGMMAYHGTKAAYAFRRQRHDAYNAMREQAYSNTIGGNYMDTQQALTMRQAAVQQIQGNKLNARSALGGEAKIFSQNYGYKR